MQDYKIILRNLEDSQKWLFLSILKKQADAQLTIEEIKKALEELLER